jgi:hypothetical protein
MPPVEKLLFHDFAGFAYTGADGIDADREGAVGRLTFLLDPMMWLKIA